MMRCRPCLICIGEKCSLTEGGELPLIQVYRFEKKTSKEQGASERR
ncbi:MAG: hypothetical protein OEY50_05285 [Nitrospinota bacterium]|nr:hypothetical protein [Nitrospinota bacterium]